MVEACGGANYWARVFCLLGHEVKLIAPQFVAPYRRGNKNDYNDAQAIAEAGLRPDMQFVCVFWGQVFDLFFACFLGSGL